MDITYEQSLALVQKHFAEHPEFKAVIDASDFKSTLTQLLQMVHVDASLQTLIESEIVVVLALFEPVSALGKNIAETTGVPFDTAEKLATLIDATFFDSVREQLYAYDIEYDEVAKVPNANIEAKEKLELRPNVPPPTPAPAPVSGTPAPTPAPVATTPLRAVPPPAPLPTVRTTPLPATPQAVPSQSTQSRPLTREDLMNALGAKRTMAGDMERARGAQTTPPPPRAPVPPPPSSDIPTPPPSSSSIPPPPPSSR